jgi:hypothetical protein
MGRGGRRVRTVLVAAAAVLALAACSSPEARRARAGGPGADVGNHGRPVSMHEGSDPYHDTPRVASGPIGGPPLDAARQAARLSR